MNKHSKKKHITEKEYPFTVVDEKNSKIKTIEDDPFLKLKDEKARARLKNNPIPKEFLPSKKV